jgi:hypothetical protein
LSFGGFFNFVDLAFPLILLPNLLVPFLLLLLINHLIFKIALILFLLSYQHPAIIFILDLLLYIRLFLLLLSLLFYLVLESLYMSRLFHLRLCRLIPQSM